MKNDKQQQIIDFIMENIYNERYKPGTRIMSEPLLQERFEVARLTVRRAIDKLVERGIVEKVRGSGNYVHKDYKQKKYIVITIIESLVNSQTGMFYLRLINYLKDKITEIGYIPYVNYEQHEHYKTDEIVKIPLDSININSVAGVISILGDKNVYQEFEDNNIPIIVMQSEHIYRYPGVTTDHLYYYGQINFLLEKYNLKDVLMFRYDQTPFNIDGIFFYDFDIDNFFKQKYNLHSIVQSFNIKDIAKQMEKTLKTINKTPDCIVFFDDTLYTTCQNLFTKYDNIFKNTKIITLSINNELYLKDYKVCKLTYYIEEFGDKAIALMKKYIDKENPLIVRYNVRCQIINEEILASK
ncbi:MAG: GntR family transcriptional regulator [Abditibacteriota bacterium]|nr:GntR family transcriptional regulator [Abditibacteriota bacterium]